MVASHHVGNVHHSRAHWRTHSEQARARAIACVTAVNEPALHLVFARITHDWCDDQERLMSEVADDQERTRLLKERMDHYSQRMQHHCRSALCERDRNTVEFAADEPHGLRMLALAGAVDPLASSASDGASTDAHAHEVKALQASLEATRATRAHALRARILGVVRSGVKLVGRRTPAELTDESLRHVASLADARDLALGKVLVLDPSPPLLPADAMADAMQDLLTYVRGGYAMPSAISCNPVRLRAWMRMHAMHETRCAVHAGNACDARNACSPVRCAQAVHACSPPPALTLVLTPPCRVCEAGLVAVPPPPR